MNLKKKKNWLTFGCLIFVLTGIFLIVQPTFAGFIEDAISKIFETIARFLGIFVTWTIDWITGIAQYNNFLRTSAVNKGWEILRDLANMFFILMLLVIAFATVLKIEKYSYKTLLAPVLLMAVLVNFSKMICGLVIDFAQVIMLSFVNAFKDIASGNLSEILGLKTFGDLGEEITVTVNDWNKVWAWILACIMMFVALVVTFIILALLIMRIIALWIMIVLSPLAFICFVIPGGQKYAKQWQDKFFNQVIVGPVLAFFLWFAFYAVQQGNLNPTTGMGLQPGKVNVGPTVSGQSNVLASFALGIGMLIGALVAAQQLGVAGASLAGKGISFLQKSATKAAKWTARRLEGLKDRTMRAFRPVTTDLAAAIVKTPLALLTKGGKGVADVWKGWAEKASVTPIPAFVKKTAAKFAKLKGEKDLTVTEGMDLLKGAVSEQDWQSIENLKSRLGTNGGWTTDEKNQIKKIVESSNLETTQKEKLKDNIDKDIKTIEGLKNEQVVEKINEIVGALRSMLTRKGLSEKEINAQLGAFNQSGIKRRIEEIMRAGGAPQKEVQDLIDQFLGKMSQRRLPGAEKLPQKKSFTDQEKEQIEILLSKHIPIFTPLSKAELARFSGGVRGGVKYELDQIKKAHQADPNLTAISQSFEQIENIIDPHLKVGQISLTDRRKVKEQIGSILEQLMKENKLSEQEGASLKTKLLTQIELIPPKAMTTEEVLKQIGKDAFKWAAEKITLPLSYVAATLEATPDIPIFDLDALLKDIQNFNARRTRKREADRLGKLHDLMNLWVSWGKDQTDFKGNEIMRRVLEEKEELQNKTLGETHATLNELESALKGNDMPRANAALMILAENNDLNELFKGDWVEKFTPYLKKFLAQDYLGKTVEVFNEKTGKTEPVTITPEKIEELIRTAKTKGEVNPVFIREMVKNISLMAAKDEGVAAKIANMIGMISLEHGAPHMGYAISRLNPVRGKLEFSPFRMYIDQKGNFDITLSQETINEIVGKVKNMSQRMMYQRAHPGLFATEDMYGNMRGLNPLNIAFLVNAEKSFFERPNEMRDDVISKLTASLEFQKDFNNLIAQMMAQPYKFISPYLPTIQDVLKQVEAMKAYMARLKAARFVT
ncbi:MAG: hypothetical protein N2259_02970 [Patescibacteria group bacterium]|nr:hypothetical protein [Patescibacteria group bacterium]